MMMQSRHPLLSSLVAVALAAPAAAAQDAPAAARPATAPTTRRAHAGLDLEGPALRYHALFPKPADLVDPDRRAANGPEAIAVLSKVVSDIDGQSPGTREMYAHIRDSFATILVVLGDGRTRSAVERQAAGTGPDADRAGRVLLTSRWLLAGRDPAGQAAMADDVGRTVQDHPTDENLTLTVLTLANGAATPELKRRMQDLALNHMKNPTVAAYKARAAKQDEVRAVEGKPMVVSGERPDGTAFTTADWKGKVVLVDFWAAWCGPCKAELPRVRKAYADYHGKGLEVLGIDNDYTARAVTAYTATAEMPWPELFDAPAAAARKWNSITTGFGIDGIPVMFLIDKNGVCRTVEARDDFETLIPKLLAE